MCNAVFRQVVGFIPCFLEQSSVFILVKVESVVDKLVEVLLGVTGCLLEQLGVSSLVPDWGSTTA